jgi:hypothetical protein
MSAMQGLVLITAGLLSLLVVGAVAVPTAFGGEPVFDNDPQHPWNILHRALYTRTMQDGRIYDPESLDPPFIPSSKFLTDGTSHRRVLAALDEFLKARLDTRIRDPLKRAVLQRDLWAVFAMIADPDAPRQPQRRALQKRLAQGMRRIALNAKEIEALPDNLAAAVHSAAFPAAFDPNHPDRYFLSPDLLDRDGPWVVVGNRWRPDSLAAPTHAEFTKVRSAFLILIRFPGGRKAVEEYLTKRKDSTQALLEPPPGTQLALMRRMILIDNSGVLRAAPIIESLQIRVSQPPKPPAVYDFTLQRHGLFNGRNSGLRPVDRGETAYYSAPVGLVPEPQPSNDESVNDPLELNRLRPAPVVMNSCLRCHGGPGTGTIQSFYVGHFQEFPLYATDHEGQVSHALDATRKTYAWGLLEGLWETLAPGGP